MAARHCCEQVFFVDDEPSGIAVTTAIEQMGLFPGINFLRSNRLDDVVAHARVSAGTVTLYVLDSKVPTSLGLVVECRTAILRARGFDICKIPDYEQSILRGVYVGAMIKIIRNDCPVVLLTGYSRIISEIQGIGPLLANACDEIRPKRELADVLDVMKRYLKVVVA